MKIVVRFEAQLRHAFGKESLDLNVEPDTNITNLFQQIIEHSPADFSEKLLGPSGSPIKSLLIFVNDQPVLHEAFAKTKLSDGDSLTIFSPIAGG